MTAFTEQDLRDSTFHRCDLTGTRFEECDLTKLRIREVELTDTTIRGAIIRNVDIDAEIEGLVVNGVDVMPLVEAELDRRQPERAAMRPTDLAGFRTAWQLLDRLWDETVERARRLPPTALDESVDGEWSFIQTLRHLVMATDSWIRRVLQSQEAPHHRWGLSFDGGPEIPGLEPDARPTLDEILAVRRERRDGVRELLTTLDDSDLDTESAPTRGPGWPPEGRTFTVRRCLRTVVNEEWLHRGYAERDLAVLADGATDGSDAGGRS